MRFVTNLRNSIIRQLGFLLQQRKLTSLLLSSAFLVSCQSTPTTKTSQKVIEQGIWTAKILLKRKNKKTYSLNAYVRINKDNKSRIDLSLPSGMYLVGLVADPGQYEMVVPRDKKIYRGTDGKSALKKNLGVSLSPQILSSIFTNRPITQKNWSCAKGEKPGVQTCKNLRSRVKIQWLESSGQTRKVNIRSKGTLAKLLIRTKDRNPKFKEKDFQLKKPKSFEVIETDL